MDKRLKWISGGSGYYPLPGNASILDSLGRGVFQICEHPVNRGQLGLQKLDDSFKFDFKIYDLGCEGVFTKIIDTWNGPLFKDGVHNLGVIFNGFKGTGKTVAAKILCNRIGLPVVIVPQSFDNILGFIQSLDFECVVLIDEAEKTFKDDREILLKLIDGVYNDRRKLYILTTNELNVDNNLLGRPGRIRYIKHFDSLSEDAVSAYLDDNLADKTLKEKVFEVVDALEMSTIDILRAIVEEFNSYGEVSDDNILNLPRASYQFDIIRVGRLAEDKFSQFESFITSRMSEGQTVDGWLKKEALEPIPDKWISGDDDDFYFEDREPRHGRLTNETLVNRTFRTYITRNSLCSYLRSLSKGQQTDDGVIRKAPDEYGFFITYKYGKYSLCCLIRSCDAPSLFKY